MLCIRLVFGLLLGLLFIQTDARAQESPKSLLWEISGNGLAKPSYLYGTAHLRDERVFQFSDTVMIAFHRCEAVALELDIDSVMKHFIIELSRNPELRQDSPPLDSLLSAEEYREMDSVLRKHIGRSADEMKNFEPRLVKSLLLNTSFSQDEPMFLDAYFHALGKKHNKRMIGLEHIGEQLAPDTLISEAERVHSLLGLVRMMDSSAAIMDRFLEAYQSADLEPFIDSAESGWDSLYNWAMVDFRNMTMVERAIPHIEAGPTFIAVGAAHLPGENGMISLLRRAGYTVRAVAPLRTALAEELFESVAVEFNWREFRAEKIACSVEMPWEPTEVPVAIPGAAGMKAHVYMAAEIGTEQVFMLMGFRLPAISPDADKDTLAEKFLDNVVRNRGGRILAQRDISDGEVYGVQAEAEMPGGKFQRLHLYLRAKQLVILAAIVRADFFNSAEIEHFFDSFAFLAEPRVEWVELERPEDGFTVSLPNNYQLLAPDLNLKDRSFTMVSAEDEQQGLSAFVGLVRFDATTRLEDEEIIIETMLENMQTSSNIEFQDKRSIELMSRPGIECNTTLANGDRMYYRIYVRSNMVYMLGLQSDKGYSSAVQRVFDSFRFLDPPPQARPVYTNREFGFTVALPPDIVRDSILDEHSVRSFQSNYFFQTLDREQFVPQMVAVKTMGPYGYIDSGETLEYLAIQAHIDKEYDSVAVRREVQHHGMNALEVWVRSRRGNFASRYLAIRKDDRVYMAECTGLAQTVESAATREFFDSFKPDIHAYRGQDPYARKTRQLLNDYASGDSATQVSAESILWNVGFLPQEIPDIYAAVDMVRYADSNRTSATRARLLTELEYVNDSTTPGFIRERYHDWHAHNERYAALTALLLCRTDEAVQLYLELTSRYPLAPASELEIIDNVLYESDSIAIMRPLVPRIWDYSRDSAYAGSAFSAIGLFRSSDVIGKEELKPYAARILHYARRQWALLQQAQRDSAQESAQQQYAHRLEEAVFLLSELSGNSEAVAFLASMLEGLQGDQQQSCAVALLKLEAAVPDTVLVGLAARLDQRIDLFNRVKELGLEHLFPARYRTQEAMAEAMIYLKLQVYHNNPVLRDLEYLSDREITIEGERKRYMLFRFNIDVAEEGISTERYCIVGPESVDTNIVETAGLWRRVDTGVEFRSASLKQDLDEYFAALVQEAATQENE